MKVNALKGLIAEPKSRSKITLALNIYAIGPRGLAASVQIAP